MLFDSLDAVNGEDMLNASIYSTHFLPDEWGGANDSICSQAAFLASWGRISRRDEQGLHYYPMCFALDPVTGAHSPVTIVASRAEFPPGPSKHPDLNDVLFTAGIIRNQDGTATLYTGMSDCEAGCAEITDPFISFERPDSVRGDKAWAFPSTPRPLIGDTPYQSNTMAGHISRI